MTIGRLLLTLILLLIIPMRVSGQSTSVSGTITDSGGQAWINGTYTFTSSALGQTPITGTLDGAGAFTSVTFPHNSFTAAVGDIWTARICPDATSPCYTKTVAISGATQSLTSTLVPAAISITIPFYPGPISFTRAYADAEITGSPKGGYYYNTTSSAIRVCTTVSGSTCTVWAAVGGTGSFINPMTTLGDIIIENGVPAPDRLPGPTTPNGVPQILTDIPSGGVAAAELWALPGVSVNAQTGATYTIAVGDRARYVSFSNAGAIAVTLPQAGSAGFDSNFVFVACDLGAGTATITPTTSTISYSNGSSYTSAASSIPLATGQCAWIYSDNANYFAIQRTSGSPVFPVTVSGTVTSGGVPYFNSTTQESSSALLSSNVLVKGGGAGGAPANSSVTDNGTTVTTTDTGGYTGPVFTASGSTAGYFQCIQGTANGHGTANTITEECPAAVTAYELVRPGTASTGIPLRTNAASVVTESVLTSTVAGDVLIGNGTTWSILGGNTSGSQCLTETSSGVVSWGTCGGGTITYPVTVAGTVTSGGIPYFNSTTQSSSSAALTANVLVKGGGAGAAPASSLTTDDGTTSTYTGTGGTKSPIFTSTGSTAGFVDYPQGSTSAAVAPCNTATSICEQAPTAVTSYLLTKAGTAASGLISNSNNSNVITQSITGDTNHSTHATAQTATKTIYTLCPASAGGCNVAGQYRVDWYFNQGGTACGTPGTGGVTFALSWTDNAGAHSAVALPMDDSSSLTATGTKFTFQTSNTAAWAQGVFNIWSTGAQPIQVTNTYTACSVGTGTWELAATVVQLQ